MTHKTQHIKNEYSMNADNDRTGGLNAMSVRSSRRGFIHFFQFYGDAHQEVGGVFERNSLIGAFGAKRK